MTDQTWRTDMRMDKGPATPRITAEEIHEVQLLLKETPGRRHPGKPQRIMLPNVNPSY